MNAKDDGGADALFSRRGNSGVRVGRGVVLWERL